MSSLINLLDEVHLTKKKKNVDGAFTILSSISSPLQHKVLCAWLLLTSINVAHTMLKGRTLLNFGVATPM